MGDSFQRYKDILDPADTIYAANFLLGYFGHVENAPELMRLQKTSDLKKKDLWSDKKSFSSFFKTEEVIDPTNPDFGINVFPVGFAVDGRSKKPAYEQLLELTSSHINNGGHGKYDFVVTLTKKHTSARLVKDDLPKDEFILGFIRLDSGVLNNAPLQKYLDIPKLNGQFVNAHIVCGVGILPTQPFGSTCRGGKLVALIATSNELRDFYNSNFEKQRRLAVFYTTSLYGTSKSSCQYDQLDRYLKFIGNTTGGFALRIKEPHKAQLIEWLSERGISRYNFTFTGSNKADRSHNALVDFIGHCLRKHSKDPNILAIKKKFNKEMDEWKNGKTEVKRTYLSTYGFEHWQDNIINQDNESNDEYDLAHLFNYWKTKVFKKRDWGLRKSSLLKNDIHLSYELISDNLRNPTFNQVR